MLIFLPSSIVLRCYSKGCSIDKLNFTRFKVKILKISDFFQVLPEENQGFHNEKKKSNIISIYLKSVYTIANNLIDLIWQYFTPDSYTTCLVVLIQFVPSYFCMHM